MPVSITELKENARGKVAAINGDRGLREKMENLGVRVGTVIIKKSTQLFKGPVLLEVGNAQVAVGFRMARKIIVEPVE